MQYSQNDARKANWRQIEDQQQQRSQNNPRANQQQYHTQDTRNVNPVIQSLSDRLRPDMMTDDMNSQGFGVSESQNYQNNIDNSYYINFADDNNSFQGGGVQTQTNSNNNPPTLSNRDKAINLLQHQEIGRSQDQQQQQNQIQRNAFFIGDGSDVNRAQTISGQNNMDDQDSQMDQYHQHQQIDEDQDDGQHNQEELQYQHQHQEEEEESHLFDHDHYDENGQQMHYYQHDHNELEQDNLKLDDTMNDLFFQQQQQQTSQFPNSTRNYQSSLHQNSRNNPNNFNSTNQVPTNQQDQQTRQQKIKEMLKEFSKKKDKVIKEQIKQRVGGNNNNSNLALPSQLPQLSSRHSTSKQIYFVDQHANATPNAGGGHGGHHPKQSQPTIEFTVEDQHQKTKYQIGQYKSVCSTCKAMKQAIELKKAQLEEPRRVGGGVPITKAEPAFIDVKKLKQKLNITTDQQFGAAGPSTIQQYNQNSQRLNHNQNRGDSLLNPITGSILTPSVVNTANASGNIHTPNSFLNQHQFNQQKTPNRYAYTPRTQELRDYSYDDLIKLIEQLERENAELREALQDALNKLARVENRDDLILQYQNELQIAKQRLNTNTQALKDIQNIFKLLLGLVNEQTKLNKTLPIDQNLKKKLNDVATRMKQLIGGQDTMDKFESLIQDNNLQGLMQECLKTKVKNLHQQEILNMERDFQKNIDKMREKINEEVMRKFKLSVERQNEDITDKQEQIDELKEIKAQLKEEIAHRDQQLEQMQQQLAYMEEDRQQLEEIVKEADQALLLRDQYGMLQQEHSDMKQRMEHKIEQLEKQYKQMEQDKESLQQALQEELRMARGDKENLLEQLVELEKKNQELVKEVKKLDELQHLKEKMEEVDLQRQSFAEKEKVYEQKERNRKLLQEQLDDLEERYRLMEKAKKKLEIDLAMQKQTKEKLIEQGNEKEEELKKKLEEMNQLIQDKVELESQLHNKQAVLHKVEAQLQDKREFQKLEDLVQQVQTSIMLKSQSNFSEPEKQLIRELFGMQPGEQQDVAEKMQELREENNQLYFEIRNEYDHEIEELKKQKDYLRQLQDFSRVILTIDDGKIQQNYPFTMQKRNKAPLFSNVDQLISEVQQRIDEIDIRQKGLDRKSLVTGIEKYDDAFKKPQSLSKRSSNQSLHKSLNNMLSTTPMNRNSKRNLGGDGLESSAGQSGALSGQMFATMQTPRNNNNQHKLLPNDDDNATTLRNPGGRVPPQTVIGGSFNMPGGGHHKKTSTISGDIMKDAVDDPMFIEELISGIDASREQLYAGSHTGNIPNIRVDRATLDSDYTNQGGNQFNSARGEHEENTRQKYRQSKLKNQNNPNNNQLTGNNNNEVIGGGQPVGAGGRSSIRSNQGANSNRFSRQFKRQITSNEGAGLQQKNTLNPNSRYGVGGQHNPNKSINESGIYFFQDQQDIGDSFEVRLVGEGEVKSDLLQFIHCQAMFIEENKECLKLNFGADD